MFTVRPSCDRQNYEHENMFLANEVEFRQHRPSNLIWIKRINLWHNYQSPKINSFRLSHPAKIDLSKKKLSKQKTIQNFKIDAQGFRKTRKKSPPNPCRPTCQPRKIGWHWLAGNSYFPFGRIFISSFSEPLGINIEILNGCLLW